MTNDTISVIVPTFNGANKIGRVLDGLLNQTVLPFEIIVVVDGSTDGTLELLQRYQEKLKLKVINQENKGRAGSRNSGAMVANGSYFLFFDDDMVLPSDIVANYYKYVQVGGKEIIVGSLYGVHEKEDEFSAFCDYLNRKWDKDLERSVKSQSISYITACNFLISRQIFINNAGFNHLLNDGEDFELALRLVASGHKIYYEPSLKIGHFVEGSFLAYSNRLSQYAKYRKVVNQIHNMPIKNSLKSEIFHILSNRIWLNMCEKGFFKILPQNVRFKLYDVFVTAKAHYG